MKVLYCFMVVTAIALAEGALAPGLRVKFAMGTDPSAGTDYFFKIPLTLSQAVAEGWRQTRRPAGPMPQLTMHCYQDKVVCAFYDDIGDVAGLQIALHKHLFTNNNLSMERLGFTEWKTAVDGKCVVMYTIQQYFVSEETFLKSKEERIAARDAGSGSVLKENAVWLTGTDGERIRVSGSEANIIDQGLFLKQACVPWMGQHWYYKTTPEMPCDEEHMYSWFPMTLGGELISSGFVTFGTLPFGEKDWFERPTAADVKMIVPTGPQCMYDLAAAPGALTMHIYYTETPWLISC